MTVSEDPTTGTNQKACAFWTRIHIRYKYNKNVNKANKKRESDPDWKNYLTINPRDLSRVSGILVF
jgi:hypothetical protein